jgi:hypothetical protein
MTNRCPLINTALVTHVISDCEFGSCYDSDLIMNLVRNSVPDACTNLILNQEQITNLEYCKSRIQEQVMIPESDSHS